MHKDHIIKKPYDPVFAFKIGKLYRPKKGLSYAIYEPCVKPVNSKHDLFDLVLQHSVRSIITDSHVFMPIRDWTHMSTSKEHPKRFIYYKLDILVEHRLWWYIVNAGYGSTRKSNFKFHKQFELAY